MDIIKKANQIASEVMEAAVEQSGQRTFVRQYLYVLWPSAKALLVQLSRYIGGEIRLPGDEQSLLARSIATGAKAFAAFRRQERDKFSPVEWDKNMYFLFFEGLCRCASSIGCCQVSNSDGSSWALQESPFIDWRLRYPGPVKIEWQQDKNNGKLAVQLACRSLLSCSSPRSWANLTLIKNLVTQWRANDTALTPSGSG